MLSEIFHARHACGHTVYWSDAPFAEFARMFPCPWCGGESGDQHPPDGAVLVDGDYVCVQRIEPDGSVPAWPGSDGPVIIRHRKDGACCASS